MPSTHTRSQVLTNPWQRRQTPWHLLRQMLGEISLQMFQILLTLWRILIQPRWWWLEEVSLCYLLSLSKTMGSTISTFVDNIPIVWVVKKIIGSDSESNSISVGQPLPDNPIIFIPKQGPPPREIPQVIGNPPVVEPGIIDQIKGSLFSIDQNTLIYLVGGSVLLIILLR